MMPLVTLYPCAYVGLFFALTENLVYSKQALIQTGKKTNILFSFHFVPNTELSTTGEEIGMMPAVQKCHSLAGDRLTKTNT